MSKRQFLSVLGIWIMFFLFLGIPSAWHKIIALISGLIVIITAYNLPQDKEVSPPSSTEAFVENKQQ